ncbi:MAG: hypothetical protein R3D99_00185 [Altererythrobacter sp.]
MIGNGTSNRGRWLTRSALGIALAMGVVATGTLTPTPAVAAKKNKAPKMSFSKAFVAVAGPAQTAIDGLDANDAAAVASAKGLLDQAFAAIEVEDDRFMAGTLAVSLGGKLNDPQMQRKGLKAMLASGKADPASVPRFNSIVGQLAYQAGDYGEAIQYIETAKTAGFADDSSDAILAEAYIANNQATKGLGILKASLAQKAASGEAAPEAWYRRGLAAAYKAGMVGEASDFGTMLVQGYPTSKNVGLAATIIREAGAFSSQETLDLMRLMGRTNSYNEERDYVEYIEAADPRRLPGEVLQVINAGIASGKLNSSGVFVADAKSQASGRLSADKAGLDSYARDAAKPSANEATVSGAADALLSYGRAAEAEALYTAALTKAGVDRERTLTRLGIAQFDQGKLAAAQQTFAKVTGKRASIAKLWAAYAAAKANTAPVTNPAAAAAETAGS